MSGQWSLLALVVAVAAGLTTVTVAAALVRSRQGAFFRYFLIQTLLFNLLILAGLVILYVDLHLRQQGARPLPGLLPGLLAALAVPKLGWLYAFLSMILVLTEHEPPPRLRRRFGVAVAAFIVIWAVLFAAGVVSRSAVLVGILLAVVEFAILGGAAAACVRLILRAATWPRGPMRRFLVVLGSTYLAIFATMSVSVALGMIRSSGQTPAHLLFNSLLMVVYNLFPLAWILRRQSPIPATADQALQRYGITPREREIIDQIRAGRTNQEIADRLFVSLATVKDHVYNIFRKTGVRNRVELANLMGDRSAGGEESRLGE